MKNIRLLIVDDEPPLCWSLKSFMEDFDHEVTTAASAEEALEILSNESFDAGIIDLRLPAVSGDKLILKIHTLHPEMKFLIHTGSVDFTINSELEAIGMTKDDIYLKPLVDMTVLIDGLERVLMCNG